MPRFFFHVSHGSPEIRDTIGTVLTDEKQAWDEATRACGEMISELDGQLSVGTDWCMEVDDAKGPVFEIRFGAKKLR